MEDDLKCPECGSLKVATTAEQMFMVNTGEHYCHSVKAHDADSKATCLACRWTGRRDQLVGHNAALRGDSGLIAGVPLESTVMQED